MAQRLTHTCCSQPDGEGLKPPFVAGNDGLAVVVKVGPGVKFLSENDWVIPNKPAMGTWQSLVTWKEKDVIKKEEGRLLVLDVKPEYFIDRINNGLYR